MLKEPGGGSGGFGTEALELWSRLGTCAPAPPSSAEGERRGCPRPRDGVGGGGGDGRTPGRAPVGPGRPERSRRGSGRGKLRSSGQRGLCAGIVGSSGEGPGSRVTGPQWVERPLEGRGMRSWSGRPLRGSGPGCAGGRPLGGWGWRSGCGDEGSWDSVCGVRVPRGWGPWCPGGGLGQECPRVCPSPWRGGGPGRAGKRVPGWGWGDAGREGPPVGSWGLGRVGHPGCGEGSAGGSAGGRSARDPGVGGAGGKGSARPGKRGAAEGRRSREGRAPRLPGGRAGGASYNVLCSPRGPGWARARPGGLGVGWGAARREMWRRGRAAAGRPGGGSALASGSLYCVRDLGNGSPQSLPGLVHLGSPPDPIKSAWNGVRGK